MELERRTLPRRSIHLPVVVNEHYGVTTDLSGTGVRFEADRDIEPGSDICFAVSFNGNPRRTYWLRCEGRVVRVEQNDHRIFVAATIDNISFDEPTH